MRATSCNLLHINTSLGRRSVVRDGLYVVCAGLLRGVRRVVFFHGWNETYAAGLVNIRLRLFKWVFFRADALVVLTKSAQEQLRRWGYNGPIYCETTMVADSDFQERITRPNNGIPQIVFLGRVERYKGILDALEAMRILRSRNVAFKFIVAGEGGAFEEAKAYAQAMELPVEFLGWVNSKSRLELLRGADVFLLPSHGEGMPISLLEAMASSVPIVTTMVGGIRDFFEDFRMGRAIERADPELIANALEWLLNNPEEAEKISRFNFDYARRRFRAGEVVQRLERIYANVLSRGHPEAALIGMTT